MSRYLDRITARFKRQEAKGIAKYGQRLEDNPRGVIEALEYLAEELTDGLMYIEEAIEKLTKPESNDSQTTKGIICDYCGGKAFHISVESLDIYLRCSICGEKVRKIGVKAYKED